MGRGEETLIASSEWARMVLADPPNPWGAIDEKSRETGFTDLLFNAGALLKAYPKNDPSESAPVVSPDLPKLHSREEIEARYRERVETWPKGVPSPSEDDDLNFLKTLNPGISRKRVREIRGQRAPDEWKAPGRRKRTES